MSTTPDPSSSGEDEKLIAQSEKQEKEAENADYAQLPPEAQGETNGGPLGCCLGVMIGLLLSISIALLSRFYGDVLTQTFSSSLSSLVRITMALVALAGVIICGYFGWKIGKKLYRTYDLPVVKKRGRKTKVKN